MKLFKYLLLLFVIIGFAACKDDDVKVNTAPDVTVEFATDSLLAKEGMELAQIPIVLKGNPNGKVKVTIEVRQADNTDDPAIEDVHYYVTTKNIWIYPDTKEAFFEIVPINDDVQNEARTYILTIVGVEGANLGADSQAIGCILDNDTEPYDRLTGEWIMKCVENGDDVEIPIVINQPDFKDPAYGKMLYASGNYVSGSGVLDISFNERGKFIKMMANSVICANVNFSVGPCDIVTAVRGAGDYSLVGSIVGNWNEDFTEVTFGNEVIYLGVVANENNHTIPDGTFVGVYSEWSNITFVRVEEE